MAAAPDALNIYWDHFFKAETGTYEKSSWLDLFLAEFLIRINEGANPKDLIKFCPVSGVVSLVGCELLCGIHRVTSSIDTHRAPLAAPDAPAPPGPGAGKPGEVHHGEDVEHKSEESRTQTPSLFSRANTQSSADILRQYLLGGLPWRCLVLLKALGVEGLSCCRQLSSVLIWLFGELRGGPVGDVTPAPAHAPAHAFATAPPRTPIHQLFSHKIWAKQKTSGNQGNKLNSTESPDKSSVTGQSRLNQKQSDAETKSKRKHKLSEQSSESGDSAEDLQLLNRSHTILVHTPSDDFNYFESPRSPPPDTLYTDPYYSLPVPKPKPHDYITDKHRDIINSEISSYEFTIIITDLLRELCKAESSLSGSEGSQISVQCINFSLRNLCSLQFGSLPSEAGYNGREVSRIKVVLTELLIVSLDKVLPYSDLCAKLINNGTLPMLLRILEDTICKTSNRLAKDDNDDDADETESENLLKFMFGVAYSIAAFFHCLLMQCRTLDKLREFTDQFKMYGECLRGGLLRECIELMVRLPGREEEATILAKKLIESIGKLIGGMKRIRSEVVHSAACARARHKACRARVAAGLHHHHAALGAAGAPQPFAAACCVAVLYGTLAALLADAAVARRAPLRSKILKVMLSCGACCCFSPSFLMECAVRLMLAHPAAAAPALRVLERAVYGELGAGVLAPPSAASPSSPASPAFPPARLPCAVCEPPAHRRDALARYCPHGVDSVERKSVWSFLIHYNSLLQLDNHTDVLHATVAHLLRVTPRCRTEMKHELLFSVIYPTFIVAKHRYMIRLEESAYFLTVSCLHVFASLLNTVSFAEQFIQKGGLSYVLELVSLAEFSTQCCAILEIAIVVEIFKLMKSNSEMTSSREMGSLASVRMLFESLSDMTDKFYKIYRIKLPAEKFEELVDLNKERESLALAAVNPSRKFSAPKNIKTAFASGGENVVEETIENHIEVLKNVWTFWKSCAGLCLYSPAFRRHAAGEAALLDSYGLLKVALHALRCGGGAPEVRVLVKIVEALLTVQVAVSDVTSGRSKETSCALVRAALALAPAGQGAGELGALEAGGTLRALCEALVRVCVAEPSRRHAMPRLSHAKMPPLGCSSGGSSADGSSSEDSVAGPYASEHSEPHAARPDDGYEADVEVGKLDLEATLKAQKLSDSLASMSSATMAYGPGETPGGACAAHGQYGALAHPELCLIVVDILTQLIDKAVPAEGADATDAEAAGARAAGALARACCARLGAALARARAQPPRLLSRLLAPPTARLLARTHPRLQDLQHSVLELVHVVAVQGVAAGELAALLRLLTADAPPLTPLLGALRRLLAAAAPHTPDCILTFPVDRAPHDNKDSLSEQLGYVSVSAATSQSQQAESWAKKLYDAHTKAGISSAWSTGALRCGVEGAGWAPWSQGFAAALWLRAAPQRPPAAASNGNGNHHDHDGDTSDDWNSWSAEEPERRPAQGPARGELAHVLSVGHDSLMFEAWLHTGSGSFTFRLSRPDPACDKVLSETRVDGGLAPDQWSCVVFNVKEVVHKRRIHIQVTLYVNGCECETVSLPLQGILVRKVTPTNVVIGHVSGVGVGGVYHMASVGLYRAPVLSVYSALHLAAHGPDSSCRVKCEAPNFPVVLTPNVIESNLDWDQVFEVSNLTLREMHDNLLLTFSAHAPHIMNLYHQTVSMPTVFSGRVASTASMMAATAAGLPSHGAGSAIPETLYPTWAGGPLPSRHRGVLPALVELGGTDVLLYMFARVVELEGSAAEQAAALGALLSAARADGRLHARLPQALELLPAVLAAPRCKLTHHMLKVILDAACSRPVLTWSGGALGVARAGAALLEPRLLVLLMRVWRQLDTAEELSWEVETAAGGRQAQRGSLWALALSCVRALAAPAPAFNHYQMARVDLLRDLLRACKERYLNSECGLLDASASSNLVELVRGLMGSPPLLDRIALLCDFLLLMHQASDTFVTHSRANFYFLLTADTADSSELTRRPARRPRRARADVAGARSSSSITSEDAVDHAARDEDKLDQSSVDSTKQMKGLINLQIKEGRKHNVSSTSENSDLTTERSAAMQDGDRVDGVPRSSGAHAWPPGRLEAVLKEYIVIDDDDVNHTTVEMYSSGIYQQRRVRAGAEPGWTACEGFLLLLRDAIAVLPDHGLQQVCTAIQAESLLVLGNHRVAGVRAALVRALAALQRRAPPDLARRLRAHHYYLHLANQANIPVPRVVGAGDGVRRAAHQVRRTFGGPARRRHLGGPDGGVGAPQPAAAGAAAVLPARRAARAQHHAHHPEDHRKGVTESAFGSISGGGGGARAGGRGRAGGGRRGPRAAAGRPARAARAPGRARAGRAARHADDLRRAPHADLPGDIGGGARGRRGRRGRRGGRGGHGGGGRGARRAAGAVRGAAGPAGAAPAPNLPAAHQVRQLLHHRARRFVSRCRARGSGAKGSRVSDNDSRHVESSCYRDNGAAARDEDAKKLTGNNPAVLSSAVSLGADAAARGERAELAARHAATAARAVAFLRARPPRRRAAALAPLLDRLLATLLPAVSGAATSRPAWWVGGGPEWASVLQELVWWCCAPAAGVRPLQPRLLRALYLAPPHALQPLTPRDPPAMRKLAVYLLTILKHIHAEAEAGAPAVERAVTDWARGWAVALQAGLAERLPAALAADAARLLAADEERWAKAAAKQRHAVGKVVFSKDALANKLTESAMGVTRQVVDVQNGERKAFLEHLRRAHSAASARAQRWQRLIDAYTHEQAVWHDPRSYPASWQLDATEGPGRVRVRLRRAHLDIQPRFLKPHARYKAETIHRSPPLRSVAGGRGGLRGGLVARLQLHETVAYMARATYVTVASEAQGELLLSDRCIHFVPEDMEEAEASNKKGEKRPDTQSAAQSWPLEAVVQVATRRWCLQERAAELFLSSGHAHLLAFADVTERTAFLKALGNCHLPGRIEPDTLTEAMNQWRNGTITNWEYLMRLNGLGGRTYNDLMQYPVLPFVIADYTSRILDLTDPASFRDLSRPMAIQNKNREQHYINTYNDLKAARREGCSPLLSRQPHHYASLYSNSGGVLHYLVRLPPFTQLFLNYQDNNFDMPDRTFHSLATTWRLITNDSPTDVKELIPELFYLPELFHNNEDLNLGVRQCGLGVDSVELPPWAADARLFTLVHRQALEAPLVTESLPHWIDLVFGYKQTGQPAIDALNVFPACTYYGFDPTALEDEVDRTAAAAMVRTYGQAPRQLLRAPHPHRAPDLLPAPAAQVGVWAGVEGARWGRYCGSPALPAPHVAARRRVAGAARVQPLPRRRAAAVAALHSALLATPGEPCSAGAGAGAGGAHAAHGEALALASWGHSDGVLRLKRRRDACPDLLMQVANTDQITAVATSISESGCPTPLFVGHLSGLVVALSVRAGAGGALRTRTRRLLAHRARVADVHVCARAGLLATASVDGCVVLWDLNNLDYIRTLPNRDMLPVTHVTISETLCDVATVHDVTSPRPAAPHAAPHAAAPCGDDVTTNLSDSYEKDATYKYSSLIRVHTVNAGFVGSVKVSEAVTCVCYSRAPEGVSVNVVAAGLARGGVRLYSAWDLRCVRLLPAPAPAPPAQPLLSLAYSSDSALLFACWADGTCAAWEAAGAEAGAGGAARLVPAAQLL